ncbi:hypothetical protein AAAZ63_07725 [Bacteroides xylanisolvens]
MEGRVKVDIWYMEHWTMLLDLYIIYKTIANIIVGEKKHVNISLQAYYECLTYLY